VFIYGVYILGIQMNVWIGQILYMEMTHAIEATKSMFVTIPAVRGAVDASVTLSTAKRPGFPFGLKNMTEGATEGLTEGDIDRAAEGMSDGVDEGETEGTAERDADRATEGMTEVVAEGLPNSSTSRREGKNVPSSKTALSALLCR
jgi:hypothetical protein